MHAEEEESSNHHHRNLLLFLMCFFRSLVESFTHRKGVLAHADPYLLDLFKSRLMCLVVLVA